ncbi:MAG: TonB-dependent receptor [Saprospiraceae bacterium]
MRINITILFTFVLAWNLVAQHEGDTLLIAPIETIKVTSTRISGIQLFQPLAVAVVKPDSISMAATGLSIHERLAAVPGVWSLNAWNFAQDARISIRGYGSRAAFGIRGIKLVVDGVPETTPDGQGQVDNLDLGLTNRIEVIRGPSAGLYGNASGGVISLQSAEATDGLNLSGSTSWGQYGWQRHQLTGGWGSPKHRLLLSGNHGKWQGYRANSQLEQTQLSLHSSHQLAERSSLSLRFNYTDSPVANDPGGLNETAVEENRQQAYVGNVQFKSGEAIRQWKAAATWRQQLSPKAFLSYIGYLSGRSFTGRQPFLNGGYIDLQRLYGGHTLTYQQQTERNGHTLHWQAGAEFHFQGDDRRRFQNEEGLRGDLVFDQRELFHNFAAWVLLEGKPSTHWRYQTSLRFDQHLLAAKDHFLQDGNDTGQRSLPAANGSVAVNYTASTTFVPYVRIATGFETPTLSELSANPDGSGGFNPDLRPQRSINLEAGAKGVPSRGWQYEWAVFHILTYDEMVGYEIGDFPGRDFFRNAGQTRRTGLELFTQYHKPSHWQAALSLTAQHLVFGQYESDGVSFEGNQLPGIPSWAGHFSVKWHPFKRASLRLQTSRQGRLFINDANTVEQAAFTLVHLQAGMIIPVRGWQWIPFINLHNLTNQSYNDNVRINAFGGRYYEPAPGFFITGGVRVQWGRERA